MMAAPTGFSQAPGGFYFENDGSGPYWLDGAGVVRTFDPLSEQLGEQNVAMFRNLSTTRQSIPYPSGALSVAFSYMQLPGGAPVTGQFARIVINATSDADADGKLATDGAYIPLCQGNEISFGAPSSDPITRIDIKTSQAVGAETTLFTIIAGVQA